MKKESPVGNYIAMVAIICFFPFVLPLNAQINSIKFNHLTDTDGLSQNHAMSTFQDSKGFMWFGTYAGLNRYDGSKFKIYVSDPRDEKTGLWKYWKTRMETCGFRLLTKD